MADRLGGDARSTVRTADGSVRTLTILMLALLLAVGAALVTVTRSITKPIIDLVANAISLADGDTSVKFASIERKDEIGMVARAIAKFRDDVERQERMKNEFIATVSHELRTPVTSIMGSIGLLVSGAAGDLAAPINRLLVIALNNCKRLVLIINDILDVEKLSSGNMIFEKRPVEIRALVEQAIEGIQGIAIAVDVAVRLHESAVRGIVMADSDRLTQVITNLLSNAVKFSAPRTAVVVTIDDQGHTIRLSVRDHGPGIPDAHKGIIFDKFVQVDAGTGRAKGGIGLGLSIARQITLALGGEIGFEDAPGGGTIFSVSLPKLRDVSIGPSCVAAGGQQPNLNVAARLVSAQA